MRPSSLVLVALALYPLAGCSSWERPTRPSTEAQTDQRQTMAPLTAEERIAWNKYRRGRGYHEIAAFFRKDRTWKVRLPLSWSDRVLVRGSYDPRFAAQVNEEIRTIAVDEARRSDLLTVVLFDPYSHDDPVVVLWLSDDGTGVKESKEPPSQELANSLKAFFLHLQKKAPL